MYVNVSLFCDTVWNTDWHYVTTDKTKVITHYRKVTAVRGNEAEKPLVA